MHNNSQSRKWALVINNPLDVGLTHEKITDLLGLFSLRYYCMADEIATTGTFHTHVYMFSDSPIRFTTVKNRFPIAHIEKAYGNAQENRDYVLKCGKWSDSEKKETSILDSFIEWGDLPGEQAEKNPEYFKIMRDIQEGKSTLDIIAETPKYLFRTKEIEMLTQLVLADRFEKENRNVDVCYVYGPTGSGKTRLIFKRHDPKEICRITNYRKDVLFDSYHGQEVLVFEEFHSQIPIGDILNYLDIYPLMLPARYMDRVACYSKVYITSNWSLDRQYSDIQIKQFEVWRAFLRRIDQVIEFREDGSMTESRRD